MKERKYFFELNNFDEPEIIEENIELPPPPPTFSLDDIGSAKEIAFEDGRLVGLKEAEISRAQYIAEQTKSIRHNIGDLIDKESYRNAVFEREVLELVQSIMETLFPHFTKFYGVGELKSVISDILKSEIKTPHIVIETPIDDAEDIQKYLDTLSLKNEASITVRANPALTAGSCSVEWRNGGAVRDHQAIAREILSRLKPNNTIKTRNAPPPLETQEEKPHNEEDNLEGDS